MADTDTCCGPVNFCPSQSVAKRDFSFKDELKRPIKVVEVARCQNDACQGTQLNETLPILKETPFPQNWEIKESGILMLAR